MEAISNYLDAMFSQYPLTPRTVEAKAELKAMMEDSYAGAIAAGHTPNEALGQAISEFGSPAELNELLGMGRSAEPSLHPVAPISAATDRVPLTATPQTTEPEPDQTPVTTMSHAKNYVSVMERTRWLLAVGVAVLTLAPMTLLSLSTAASSPNFGMEQNIAVLIGFIAAAPLVGIGVGLLVWRAQQLAPFSRITSLQSRSTPEIEIWAEDLRASHAGRRTAALIAAICLWILAGTSLIASGVLTSNMPQSGADPIIGIGLAGAFLLTAVALLIFLPANWANLAASKLVGATPETRRAEEDEANRYPTWIRAVMAGFWPLIVMAFLAWGFLGGWHISWIIWPISGLAFAAFAAAVGAAYPSPPRR